MIKVILRYGAGNQLFQYAVGRTLANMNKTSLFFDVSSYGRFYKKYLILPYFHVSGRIINPIPSLVVKKIIGKPLWEMSNNLLFYEKNHRFDESVFSLPKSCTLKGFFQSEKYFRPISGIIRNDLTYKDFPDDDAVLDLKERIVNSNSVSVHVRRGDYLNNSRYDVCSMKYYEKAINFIRGKTDNPDFYFFSDDIRWCAQHFRDHDFFFVELTQSREHQINDMHLMSLCKHNIIANSSFSWWGAWLNSNPHKIVACPYMWFNANDVPIEDKICEGWSKIVF